MSCLLAGCWKIFVIARRPTASPLSCWRRSLSIYLPSDVRRCWWYWTVFIITEESVCKNTEGISTVFVVLGGDRGFWSMQGPGLSYFKRPLLPEAPLRQRGGGQTDREWALSSHIRKLKNTELSGTYYHRHPSPVVFRLSVATTTQSQVALPLLKRVLGKRERWCEYKREHPLDQTTPHAQRD